MSVASTRRNGSQPSCEPCRRAKTRCDHEKPMCGRCRRRAPDTRCWYHPTPLTQRRQRRQTNNSQEIGTPVQTPSRASPEQSHDWTRIVQYPTTDIAGASSRDSHDRRVYNEQLTLVIEILDRLRFLPLIERHIRGFSAVRQVAIVPATMVLQLLSSLTSSVSIAKYLSDKIDRRNDDDTVPHLAEEVLRNSSTDIDITPTMNVAEFCGCYCGENLRVETLGFIYAIAARSLLYGTARGDGEENAVVQKDDELIAQDLLRCSDLSKRLARDIAPQTNDVLIWLAYENMQLVTLIEGDASLGVWRRLGELSTDVTAMNLHREITHSSTTTPFFLAQCRRKTFACAYTSDKAFCFLFDRPPRIPRCYSDCKLPLDLADEQIVADTPEAVEQARCSLTEDDWNTNEAYRSTTWARVRFILSEFVEEVLQCKFSINVSAEKLRDLLKRCQTGWASIPTHVRYSRECWASDIHLTACYMLGKVYLTYLHINMQIYRLLAKIEPDSTAGMLQICADMLQTVLEMINACDRAAFMPRDVSTIILVYGLPCAGTLTTGLQDTAGQASRPLPRSLNHAALIRNLSVFIFHLESTFGPGDANYVFCAQASKAISRTLDEVLNSFASQKAVPSVAAVASTSDSLITPPSTTLTGSKGATAVADIVPSAIPGLDDFDFADWSANIDWNTASRDWNIF